MTASIKAFTLKQIDELTVQPENLSETISKLKELGYVVGVEPAMWKSKAGYYGTQYLVKVFKKELKE